MRDQAAELRNLVRRSIRVTAHGPAPVLLAVAGGKGGVGATTLAVNLALAVSELGPRVVLADLNMCRADVAPLCGIEESANVADVLGSRRDIHEALQPGPGGIQILPGAWAPSEPTQVTPASVERLLQQLRTIGRHAEVVILDAGFGAHEITRQVWTAADLILLVTTPDDVSIMDTYATIKTSSPECQAALLVVVNQVVEPHEGEHVFARLAQSCQRFLMRHIDYVGSVPHDERIAESAAARMPFWTRSPFGATAEALRQIAQALQPRLERKAVEIGS